MILFSAVFIISLFVAVALQAQKHLTVEQIYGTEEFDGTSVDGVQWTPDGKGFTYVPTKEETEDLEIWYYDLESGERNRLVSSDDVHVLRSQKREKRFTLDNYLWSPTGTEILFPYENDLYLYDLSTKDLRPLTEDEGEERDPAFSPDGTKLAYLKENNLHVHDIRTGLVAQLTDQGTEHVLVGRFDWVYEEEFDIRTGFFWSPDGEHIAYFQVDEEATPEFPIVDFIPVRNELQPVRYPKPGDGNSIVSIGVVSTEGGAETVWMDTGEETDIYIPRIQWLPDGDVLSIQRINRGQNRLDLLFADVLTGESRVVVTEEAPWGWLEPNDDLTFLTDGGSFLWSSQRDGFTHLYLYHYNGWLMRQLTGGEWDVIEVSGIDEYTETVYFVGTEKNLMERHLYRVQLDGEGFERLSRGDGTHEIDMAADCRYFLDTFSNITTPPRVSLHRSNGQLVDSIEANELKELFEEYELSPPEFLSVPADDGTPLNAFMIKPPDFDPSKTYPVLIYTYGGPGSQIVANSWKKGIGRLWHQLMAQHGFLVFGLDNRGTGGRGTEWMWTVYRKLGEYEVKDHLSGVKYLQTLPYVDGDRIGIWGWSYGGYTTCMCMLKEPDSFKVGVAVAAVTDWKNYDTIYTEKYMGTPEDNPEGYAKSTVMEYTDRLKGRLLLVHGGLDDNVHMANTMQLAQAFQNAGKQFDLMVYPDKEHSILGKEARVHLFEMITEYFLENL
jgi:dipeptidyl-peptidase-4